MSDRSTFDESIRSAVKDSGGDWTDLEPRTAKKASVHMVAKEPLIAEYDLDYKWTVVARQKQFRGALYRDRVALVRASAVAAALQGPADPTAPARALSRAEDLAEEERLIRDGLVEVKRLHAEDVGLWERRTIEDDGVIDLAHVRDHAAMRRSGSACGGCKVRPQRRYEEEVLSHSRDLDAALVTAQAAVTDLAA